MPELPKVLRDGLSERERSVLVLGSDGGAQAVLEGLRDCRSIDHAESLLNSARERAARILAIERGRAQRAPAERECGCGISFVARNGEQRCPACRELALDGARSIEDALLDAAGVPAEQAGMMPDEDEGAGEERILREEPPTLPPAPESEPEPEPEPEPVQEESSTPAASSPARQWKPAELRAEALRIVRESSGVTQAELRTRLEIASPRMATVAAWLRKQPGVVFGEILGRSPVIEWHEEDVPVRAPEPEPQPMPEPEPAARMDEPSLDGVYGSLKPQDLVTAEPEPAAVPQDLVTKRDIDPIVARRLLLRCDEARRAHAHLAGEVLALAEEMVAGVDGAMPETLLRGRYLATLLKRIEGGDTSPDLLDRFERLAGLRDD